MKIKILSLILFIFLLSTNCDNKYNDLLSIHIIDVGQGDSILINTPNNKSILVDGGNEDSDYIVYDYLKSHNIKDIDLLIATHVDSDHIGGLDTIINKFNVKSFFMPDQDYDTNSYLNLMKACRSQDLKINHLNKGDFINIEDNINLTVLSPSYIQDNNNLNSIVFRLDYIDKSFLFTGDSEIENEVEIMNNFDITNIDFLKVGHHGSNSSSSDNFVNTINPDISVISCGYNNQYNHPHNETISNLLALDSDIYRTDLNGDLVFYSDGDIIFSKEKYKQ